MQLLSICQSLNRGNGGSMRLGSWYKAGMYCLPIEPDCAGTALTIRATIFRSRQFSILAQGVQERFLLGTNQGIGLTIDVCFNNTSKGCALSVFIRRFERDRQFYGSFFPCGKALQTM